MICDFVFLSVVTCFHLPNRHDITLSRLKNALNQPETQTKPNPKPTSNINLTLTPIHSKLITLILIKIEKTINSKSDVTSVWEMETSENRSGHPGQTSTP
jgi:hypothetical protein